MATTRRSATRRTRTSTSSRSRPRPSPPVTRILDYSKYKYEQAQKQKQARKHQTAIVVREIKFRPKIAEQDYETKKRHVERFLRHKDKVKVTIMFRGREVTHPERGEMILNRLAEDLAELAHRRAAPAAGRAQHDDDARPVEGRARRRDRAARGGRGRGRRGRRASAGRRSTTPTSPPSRSAAPSSSPTDATARSARRAVFLRARCASLARSSSPRRCSPRRPPHAVDRRRAGHDADRHRRRRRAQPHLGLACRARRVRVTDTGATPRAGRRLHAVEPRRSRARAPG